MPHQANHLYDVWADGRHLIAKEYLSDVELDAPLNEYRALRLVESMDIAPPPLFFDPSVGPVVVYQYLEGVMWDRRVPVAAEQVSNQEAVRILRFAGSDFPRTADNRRLERERPTAHGAPRLKSFRVKNAT